MYVYVNVFSPSKFLVVLGGWVTGRLDPVYPSALSINLPNTHTHSYVHVQVKKTISSFV